MRGRFEDAVNRVAGLDDLGDVSADEDLAGAFAGALCAGADSAVPERRAIIPAVATTAVNQPVWFFTSCRAVRLGRRSVASIKAFLTEPLAQRQDISVKTGPTRMYLFQVTASPLMALFPLIPV
jgi:hypothetical protein